MPVQVRSVKVEQFVAVSTDAGEFRVFADGSMLRLNWTLGVYRADDLVDFTDEELAVIRNAAQQ